MLWRYNEHTGIILIRDELKRERTIVKIILLIFILILISTFQLSLVQETVDTTKKNLKRKTVTVQKTKTKTKRQRPAYTYEKERRELKKAQ